MEHEWNELYSDSFLDCTYYLCKNCNQEAWDGTAKKWSGKSVANFLGKVGEKYLVHKMFCSMPNLAPIINYLSYQETLPCDEAIMRAALE